MFLSFSCDATNNFSFLSYFYDVQFPSSEKALNFSVIVLTIGCSIHWKKLCNCMLSLTYNWSQVPFVHLLHASPPQNSNTLVFTMFPQLHASLRHNAPTSFLPAKKNAPTSSQVTNEQDNTSNIDIVLPLDSLLDAWVWRPQSAALLCFLCSLWENISVVPFYRTHFFLHTLYSTLTWIWV